MSQPLPKLIAKLQEIVNGIDRHSRVNESDLPILARALKMEIIRMKRIAEEQRILSENLALQLQAEEDRWCFDASTGQMGFKPREDQNDTN